MRIILGLLTLFAFILGINFTSQLAFAAGPTVNVKNLALDGHESTSITIQKEKSGHTTPQRPEFKIIQGSQDIEGDPSGTLQEARNHWKKACADWKSETKELNKNNEVITLDCGSPTQGKGEQLQKYFRSSGKYQLKIRMRSQEPLTSQSTTESKVQPEQDDDNEDDGEAGSESES